MAANRGLLASHSRVQRCSRLLLVNSYPRTIDSFLLLLAGCFRGTRRTAFHHRRCRRLPKAGGAPSVFRLATYMESTDHSSESAMRAGASFVSTHSSTVLAAGDSHSPASGEALERLCCAYWYPPVYAFVRRQGQAPEDARDLTRAFFERLIAKRFLKDVAPERGRFRSYLLVALTHFLANERDRVRAAKRGGGCTFASLDAAELEERYCSRSCGSGIEELDTLRAWRSARVTDELNHRLRTRETGQKPDSENHQETGCGCKCLVIIGASGRT